MFEHSEYRSRDGACEIALGLESPDGNAPPGEGKKKNASKVYSIDFRIEIKSCRTINYAN